MGNLRYYTFVDRFDGIDSLGETGTKCALRLLKYQLEDKLGFELTDEQFTAIFFRVINLGPARPLGAYSFLYGFVEPMRKLLAEHTFRSVESMIFSVSLMFETLTEDIIGSYSYIFHIPQFHSLLILCTLSMILIARKDFSSIIIQTNCFCLIRLQEI